MTTPRRGALSGGTLALLVVAAVLVVFAVIRYQRGGSPGTPPPAFAQSVELEVASTTAKNDNKPILMFFTADWCGPCKSLKGSALSDAAVVAAVQSKTVPVYVDCTTDMPSIGQQLGVEGYPTLMLVRDGKEVARLVGAVPTNEILAWLTKHAG
jgi:thioredoxin-like negative regulator of GroEL